jgi:hypothetical protein
VGRTGTKLKDEIEIALRPLLPTPSNSDRHRFLLQSITALQSGLNYATGGLDPDVLNEFPAQRLFQVRFDIKEPVDWPTFWPANGGRFFDGEMVALKWDRVWWRISAFNLPVPPFQLGSGYDIEDVDRDEAEAFGLIKPQGRVPSIKIEPDLADLKSRFTTAIATYYSPKA